MTDFTWTDIIEQVTDLIVINVIDTIESENHYSIDDISFVMTNEYNIMKDNLDEDIYKSWDMIEERIREKLKGE